MYGFNLKHKDKLAKLHNVDDFAFNLAVSRALLTGEGAVVKRFFQQVAQQLTEDPYTMQEVNQSFFSRAKTNNAFVYYGLSKMIVDGIVRLVTSGGYSVSGGEKGRLEEILNDNNFGEIWAKAEAFQSGLGDLVFKWSNDPDVSEYPILELVAPEKVELIRKRQRVIGIDLKERIAFGEGENRNEYEIHEIYRKEKGNVVIEYKILDCKTEEEVGFYSDKVRPVKAAFGIEDKEQVTHTSLTEFPALYKQNTGAEDWLGDSGRGISDIHGFHTLEAALSEVLSNTVDEVRKAALKIFISEKLIPKNPDGTPGTFDHFDKDIEVVGGEVLEGDKLLQAFSPDVHSDKFLQTVKEIIANMCNKAGISPLTIGVTGLESIIASAESQQEREGKTSLRKRSAKLNDWREFFKRLFNAGMQMHDYMKSNAPGEYDFKVEFGEYTVPTTEERVATLTQGITNSLFSIREAINEYYGNNKTDEQKEKIYLDIKIEKGLALTREEYIKVNGQEPPATANIEVDDDTA